jgi:DNA-binding GntR family transcriptional regulator
MEELGLSEGEKVTRIQRIQLADENPIVIMKNYVPSRMVPGMENQAEKITSLYQYLEDVFNIHIDSAHDRISARAADFNQAQMLNIPVGSPLLYMRRVCYSNGIAVCADHISVIADKYELEVEMIGRENRNIY